MQVKCKYCTSTFAQVEMLKPHEDLHCIECGKWFVNETNLYAHARSHTSSSSTIGKQQQQQASKQQDKDKKKFILTKKAFANRIQTFSYRNENEEILLPEEFFSSITELLMPILLEAQQQHITFKYNIELVCDYIKIVDEEMKLCTISHHSKMKFVTLSDDVAKTFSDQSQEICTKMSEFQERDSGWTLITIRHLHLNVNRASFIRGSKYIPLPGWIEKKQACFNIRNDDGYCFKWCVIAFFYEDKLNMLSDVVNITSNIINVRNETINFSWLEFPMKLKDIKRFEELNNNISINVFGCEENSIVGPYHLTACVKQHHINLLLLIKEDCCHYVLITDISR